MDDQEQFILKNFPVYLVINLLETGAVHRRWPSVFTLGSSECRSQPNPLHLVLGEPLLGAIVELRCAGSHALPFPVRARARHRWRGRR